MTDCSLDAFAHLSPDIAFDVLRLGYHDFKELAPFDLCNGIWGDVARCGKLRKAKFDVTRGEEHFVYVEEWFNYSHYCKNTLLQRLQTSNDLDLLLLNDVTIVIGVITPTLENMIFQRAFQNVTIRFDHRENEGRAAEVFAILATRPISKLEIKGLNSLYSNFSPSKRDRWQPPLEKLIRNPSIQQLIVDLFADIQLMQAFQEFVRKPNFLFFWASCFSHVLMENEIKIIEAALTHWLQRTTFPSHMQRVCFQVDHKQFLSEIGEKFGFQEIRRLYNYKHIMNNFGCYVYVYYLEHPTNPTKRCEVFFAGPNTSELCFTSKEDSVWAEFPEYSDFLLRELIHRKNSFNPSSW